MFPPGKNDNNNNNNSHFLAPNSIIPDLDYGTMVSLESTTLFIAPTEPGQGSMHLCIVYGNSSDRRVNQLKSTFYWDSA